MSDTTTTDPQQGAQQIFAPRHADPHRPFDWYARMRRDEPVWLERELRLAHLFRYDDVRRALTDHQVFSSQLQSVVAGGAEEHGGIGETMAATDPPRHRDLRSVVDRAFTPRQVEALTPRIEQLTEELLDRRRDDEPFDLVREFTSPLPVFVIAELLDIPKDDRPAFRVWSDHLVVGDPRGQQEMGRYFAALIEQRRAGGGEDLISRLIAVQDEGRLTSRELIGLCTLLLVAGNETTTNLLTNTVLTLHEHPEEHAALRADPAAMIDPVIEEVLRYRSPVQSIVRRTVQPVRLGDVEIPEGFVVQTWIGSANRDESRFADPEHFRPPRSPNKHIAFGFGHHSCLGAPLARLEARIALRALVRRFPRLEVVDPERNAMRSTLVHGLHSLTVTHPA